MFRLPAFPAQELKVIGLISFGHMLSHFFFFVLPPLYLVLKGEFQVSYTVLALPMAIYTIAAGVTQTPVGFWVDRVGARKLLIAGLILQGLSIAAIGLTTTFWQLMALYTITGIANTVFHPADYAILSGSIAKERLGRAFSLHLASGNLGWVFVPGVMIGLTELWDWRTAFIIVGMVGFLFGLIVWACSATMNEEVTKDTSGENKKAAETNGLKDGMALLFSFPIMMCFAFFIMLTIGFTGIRSFMVVALNQLYGLSDIIGNTVLTGFMAGSFVGVLIGGFVADKYGPRVATAVGTLVGAAVLLVFVGSYDLPVIVILTAITLSGILQGILLPSRDLLIRAVTPAGSMGKVVGFLTMGMMMAAAVVQPIFGWLMDINEPRWVFWLSAIFVAGALFCFSSARTSNKQAAVAE
ncbi:MAG: MFS transporter [Alphaproteobacteria bacterium]|nr:MFS transporter [Alphaproteobacteria bacterium]